MARIRFGSRHRLSDSKLAEHSMELLQHIKRNDFVLQIMSVSLIKRSGRSARRAIAAWEHVICTDLRLSALSI